MIMNEGILYILGAGASIGAKRIPKNRYNLRSRMPSGPNFFYDCGVFDAPKDPDRDFLNIIKRDALKILSFKVNKK